VESGGPSVGKVGECDVASRRLQGCSPHLCWLRMMGWPPQVCIKRTDHMLVIQAK
jgi:hypothetical protein